MAPRIELKCDNCGGTFTRLASEARRNEKRGRKVVCSRKCQGKLIYDKLPSTFGNTIDEYSRFRVFMKSVRWESKTHERKVCDIDEKFLKDLWESQSGECPFTGWKLKLKETTGHKLELTPDRASLDRIDSSKGYIKGNVRFVCWMYQVAKNSFNDEQVMDFCKAVIKGN